MGPLRYRLSANLDFNIKSHLERMFLQGGLFFNVASGDIDTNNNRVDILQRVNARVYESAFDDWCYETDISPSPIIASGVYINGTFNPKGSGTYKPSIDYRNGRVIFVTGVPTGSVVSAEFSYKHIITDFPDSRKVNLIFSKIKDMVDFTENIYPSGFERQLPAVVIDLQRRISRPFSLGGGREHNTLVVLHIISNNKTEKDQIVDLLTERSFNNTIKGVDFNKIPQLFTNNGDISKTYKNYTQLQGNLAFDFPNIFIQRAELVRTDEIRGVWISRVNWNVIVNTNGT